MNEISRPLSPAITMKDVHRAIETLAINQAQIGLSVMALLHARMIDDADARQLYDGVNKSVNELQDLAQTFLDKQFGD